MMTQKMLVASLNIIQENEITTAEVDGNSDSSTTIKHYEERFALTYDELSNQAVETEPNSVEKVHPPNTEI